MPIERRRLDGGSINVVTTGCPLCGKDLLERENYANHLRNECPKNGNGGETA